jgi:hypothetical protein
MGKREIPEAKSRPPVEEEFLLPKTHASIVE